MEKRLPLALFLSFLVLFGWQILFGPKPQPPVDDPGADTAEVEEGAETDEPAPAPEPVGDVVRADAVETLVIEVGNEGEPGYAQLTFTNRGALLSQLLLGNYYTQKVLDEGKAGGWEDHAPLLVPVDTGERVTGSLAWRASSSAEALVGAVPLDRALWVMEPVTEGGRTVGASFHYAPGTGVVFTKRVVAVPGAYRLRVTLGIENATDEPGDGAQFDFLPAACVPVELGDNFYIEPKAVAVGPVKEGEELSVASEMRDDGASDLEGGLDVPLPLAFAGVHNKYFAFFMRGADAAATNTMRGARYLRFADAEWAAENGEELRSAQRHIAASVTLALEVPKPRTAKEWTYDFYAGPKKTEVMLPDYELPGQGEPHGLILDEDLGSVPCVGGPIAEIGKLLLILLGLLEAVFGNWGVAIIVLTVCIRAALFPMNRRMQTSMARYQKKMKRVQPKLDEVKKRHEGDPQKLRQEQARIMQEEKAFPPLGGCLPVFLQMPIFFGLFAALRTSFELRQAPFAGWITDLSQPDRMLEIGLAIPLGFTTLDIQYFNLLPPLMVVLWILQQRSMPKPTDPQAAQMQKMMMWMPVIMGVFLYNYAAGLSLYMITQSGLGIFEQHFIKKRWPVKDDEPEKEKSGCGPFSGIMKNLAEKQAEHMKRVEAMQKAQAQKPSKQRKKKKR